MLMIPVAILAQVFWHVTNSSRGVNYECSHASLCSQPHKACFCHGALVSRFDLQCRCDGEPGLGGQGPPGSLPPGGEEGAPRQVPGDTTKKSHTGVTKDLSGFVGQVSPPLPPQIPAKFIFVPVGRIRPLIEL